MEENTFQHVCFEMEWRRNLIPFCCFLVFDLNLRKDLDERDFEELVNITDAFRNAYHSMTMILHDYKQKKKNHSLLVCWLVIGNACRVKKFDEFEFLEFILFQIEDDEKEENEKEENDNDTLKHGVMSFFFLLEKL